MSTTLKTILANTDIEPKVARRKLRADMKKSKSPLAKHEMKTGWTFDAEQAKHVKSLLGLTTKAAKKSRKVRVKK